MLQQRALAAAAAAHDDEDVAAADGEIEVALDDEIAIGHVQILDRDMRLPDRSLPASVGMGGAFTLRSRARWSARRRCRPSR